MTDGNSGQGRRPSWYSGGNSRGERDAASRGSDHSGPSGQPEYAQGYRSAPGMDHSRPASQVGGYGVGPGYGSVPGDGTSSGYGTGSGYGSTFGPAGSSYAPADYPATGYAPSRFGYYSPTPGTDAPEEMRYQREEKARGHHTAALVLAIIGFFTVPIILGPLAIWQATKARNLGHPGVAGLVLGWIVVIWSVTGWFFGFVMMFLVGIIATI